MDSAQSNSSTPQTGSAPANQSPAAATPVGQTPPSAPTDQTPVATSVTPPADAVAPTPPAPSSGPVQTTASIPAPTDTMQATSSMSTPPPPSGQSAASGMPATPTPPPPLPPVPSHKSSGVNKWMISTVILFVVLLGIGLFVLAKTQLSNQVVTQMPTPVPENNITTVPSPSENPVATPTASITSPQMGTVSGTLCYPSSMIPAGTITAKSTTTNKEFTKAYVGSQAGGGTTYAIDVAPDTYHLKFTPTQYATNVGYYTSYSSCVGNPSGSDCSGQKTRPLLVATVTANGTVSNVNLCDYYYPPTTPPQF